MTMDISKTETSRTGRPNMCAGCGKPITDQYMLKAVDMLWHEDCLKCSCCDCRLGEVGSSCWTKANLILCKRDYLRLFGHTGHCAACNKPIPAFEMVMRAKQNVYHLECFACQQCNHRFCVGDRFYLVENKILCEYDNEERRVFANMDSELHSAIKRHATNLLPQTVPTNGPQRQAIGGPGLDTSASHNSYPVPTSSSGHNSALGSQTILNGIGGPQASVYETK